MSKQTIVLFVTAFLAGTSSVTGQEAARPAAASGARPGAIFNALDHGVSASAADNTAAIQAAINACQKAGGGIVQLPAGVFRLTGTLTMTSNHVWLRGPGRAAATLFFDNGAADCIVVGNRLPARPPIAAGELRSNKITDLNIVFGTKTAGRTVAIINHADFICNSAPGTGVLWDGMTNTFIINDVQHISGRPQQVSRHRGRSRGIGRVDHRRSRGRAHRRQACLVRRVHRGGRIEYPDRQPGCQLREHGSRGEQGCPEADDWQSD
jgi:hypothetical protein